MPRSRILKRITVKYKERKEGSRKAEVTNHKNYRDEAINQTSWNMCVNGNSNRAYKYSCKTELNFITRETRWAFGEKTQNLLERPGGHLVLRSEIPRGMCAKLRTMATSKNRDHPTRSLSSSPFASTIYCSPGSQALLEVTHQDHSIGITLLLLVRATYIYFCSSHTSRSW